MIDFDELAAIIGFKMVISNDKWRIKVLVILILVQNIIQKEFINCGCKVCRLHIMTIINNNKDYYV